MGNTPDINAQTGIDMERARAATSIDVAAVSAMLSNSHRDLDSHKAVMKILESDPVFAKEDRTIVSRAERLARGLDITKRLLQLSDEHDWSYFEYIDAMLSCQEEVGVHLHEIAFQPVIQAQGSDEQHEEWMMKGQNHAILGCYAQTELGHGSNVQKLETTATWIPETNEFEIHSPSLTSTKWWIGGLGVTCTHSVVQARLYLKGKDYGPHLFIVQIRDMKTHKPLPGITCGEIGAKAHGGFGALDNGYIRFNRVRIPHNRMLNRFANVIPDKNGGTYSKPPHDKLSYGSMVFIRANMISKSGWDLAKAITIATRYTHVRRQFADPDSNDPTERQVVTYPSVYMRLLPILAEAYVFITMGKDMSSLFNDMSQKLAGGNTELLAETHAVSSGLKSYVTAHIIEGMEQARRACGGHGFMDSAGIARIYATNLPGATYEGDNYILNLQVARSALKSLNQLARDPKSVKLSPSSAYLRTLLSPERPSIPTTAEGWIDFSHGAQSYLLDIRAALLVSRVGAQLAPKGGKKWSDVSWDCQKVATAITESFIARRTARAIGVDSSPVDKDGGAGEDNLLLFGIQNSKSGEVVSWLGKFYVLGLIERSLGDLLELGVIQPSPPSSATSTPPANGPSPGGLPSEAAPSGPIPALRAAISDLAVRLLPELIGLTDAFEFGDYELGSTLGRKDGRAYQALWDYVQATQKRQKAAETEDDRRSQQRMLEDIKWVLERGDRLGKM